MKYPLLVNNAENWLDYCVAKRHPELKSYIHQEPAPGAIGVCEGKGDLAGHVFCFEQQLSPDKWLISESSYGGVAFRTREITKTKSGDGSLGGGSNNNLRYLGCLGNPAVKVLPEPVERDSNKDQVKCLSDSLRIRADGNLQAVVLGFTKTNDIYNYSETKVADGYTWYNIGDAWCADVSLEVLPKQQDWEALYKAEVEKNKLLQQKITNAKAVLE